MKIMSFNVQHFANYSNDNKIDFESYAKAIKQYNPDIVGFNEVRGKGEAQGYENQTEIIAALTGMKYHYFAEAIKIFGKNPYGNAILSKVPIIEVKTIPIPDPEPKTGDDYYETRCVLKAKLEGGINILITHFGLNRDEQENAVKIIMENLEDEKCILMGDFNVQPDSVILEDIRKRMKDTADVFSVPMCSHPSDAPDKKIDYIFVSQDIEIVSADIPEICVSDHRPHITELNI